MHAGAVTVSRSTWWLPTWWRWLGGGVAASIALLLLLDWAFPAPYANVPLSFAMTAADGRLLHARLASDGQWRLPANDIPSRLQSVLLAKEDRWFAYHPGINPLALGRAAVQNMVWGQRVSGASTLSMQVARMLEPGSRTPLRKLREILRALQLEWHLDKAEILQLYLTLAPYGSNVQGLEAASRTLFGKPPDALSLAECVVLVLIPNNPNGLGIHGNRSNLMALRKRWLQRLGKQRLFPAHEIEAALAEPLALQRHPLPRQAPHLALRLAGEHPLGGQVRSTLKANTQAKVEQLVASYAARVRQLGIGNAAALVVDNHNRNVLAYVGSASFHDVATQGQVDGVRAVRSPGSALKPLLYALAIDTGLVSPMTVLPDVPTDFRGYAPENYDRSFRGQVTVETALAQSLNVPAVRVLEALGTQRMVEVLAFAKFGQIEQQQKQLGLSLVLGGCGVRLDEMAALYAALADGGKWRSLRYTVDSKADTSTNPARQIVSPRAAWQVTEILQQLVRPDLPNAFANATSLPRIAWKTGTSYGRRDAWAIGYHTDYTIAVWLGNFDGRGAPALSGADIATPLLFQLFNGLGAGQAQRPFRKPRGLGVRSVCAASGLPPDTFCTSTVNETYLPGISPSRRCSHLRPYWTDTAATRSYCAHCRPSHGSIRRLYADLPPDVATWYHAQHMQTASPPPHNAACPMAGTAASNTLRIASPAHQADYYLDRLARTRMALSAYAPADARTLHWFANDRYLGDSQVGEPFFFRPDTGATRITVSDDRGRTATASIRVHGF